MRGITIQDYIAGDQIMVPFLMYLEPIRISWQETHGCDIRDWVNMCWIHGWLQFRPYLTKTDYNSFQPINKWTSRRIGKYVDKGWLQKIPSTKRSRLEGNRDLYTLTHKAKKMMSRIYNQAIGRVAINGSTKHNKALEDPYKAMSIIKMIKDREFPKAYGELKERREKREEYYKNLLK